VIKTIVIGLWACVVALVSSYAGASWMAGGTVTVEKKGPFLAGMEYLRIGPLTVPLIADGKLRGYIVAKFSATVDARTLHSFPMDPQPFLLDETFRRIYQDGKVEFDKMSKANLSDITAAIKVNVNQRLGMDLIHDVLVDEVSFVDKESMNKANAKAH
jgi:hypothetical protein